MAVFDAVPNGEKLGSICARMCARKFRPQPRYGPGAIAATETGSTDDRNLDQPTGGFLLRSWRRSPGCLQPRMGDFVRIIKRAGLFQHRSDDLCWLCRRIFNQKALWRTYQHMPQYIQCRVYRLNGIDIFLQAIKQ